MKARFVDVNGIKTRVLFEGSETATPILLIHGFGIGAESWFKNIDALAENYFVVAPDLVGHGFTDPVPLRGRPPYPVNLEHLIGLLDALRLDRVVACGSSYGALLAALVWFEQPDRVMKLILNGSGSCFNTETEIVEKLKLTYENAGQAIKSSTLESCRVRMANTVFDPQSIPPEILLCQLTAYAQPHYLSWWEEAMRGMMDIEQARPYRILERLEQMDVDTLIIWGLQDNRGIYERAVEGVGRMPRADLVGFDRCGHLPYLEHPEQFHQAVRRFISEGLPS